MERRRVAIVIPALNEAATISSVVSDASQYGMPIVIDDGSSDQTCELATAAGALVVRHPVNRGYDEAINSGFARAKELGCEYVITMDADGQHAPSILQSFIQALDDGAEVVIGIRNCRQRIAEHIFAWVGSFKWQMRDPLCGMKAYRIGVYTELGHFDCYNSIGTELAIFAARTGKKIVQLPVTTGERTDEPRFGKRYSGNRRILRALWHALFSSELVTFS